jgi:hypothetical protein
LDQGSDLPEADAAIQEGLHGDFIGGIEDGRQRPAGSQGIIRQFQAGKRW